MRRRLRRALREMGDGLERDSSLPSLPQLSAAPLLRFLLCFSLLLLFSGESPVLLLVCCMRREHSSLQRSPGVERRLRVLELLIRVCWGCCMTRRPPRCCSLLPARSLLLVECSAVSLPCLVRLHDSTALRLIQHCKAPRCGDADLDLRCVERKVVLEEETLRELLPHLLLCDGAAVLAAQDV